MLFCHCGSALAYNLRKPLDMKESLETVRSLMK
jgi:hypothetical protein